MTVSVSPAYRGPYSCDPIVKVADGQKAIAVDFPESMAPKLWDSKYHTVLQMPPADAVRLAVAILTQVADTDQYCVGNDADLESELNGFLERIRKAMPDIDHVPAPDYGIEEMTEALTR